MSNSKNKNSKKSFNLIDLAMEQTKANTTKGRSSRKSINDALFELLYSEKGDAEPKSKLELVNQMSLDRLHNEYDGKITVDNFNSKEVQKEFARINKTVSNGFDTAVCNGKTSASFCSNKNYNQDYELIKVGNKYTIVDKQK